MAAASATITALAACKLFCTTIKSFASAKSHQFVAKCAFVPEVLCGVALIGISFTEFGVPRLACCCLLLTEMAAIITMVQTDDGVHHRWRRRQREMLRTTAISMAIAIVPVTSISSMLMGRGNFPQCVVNDPRGSSVGIVASLLVVHASAMLGVLVWFKEGCGSRIYLSAHHLVCDVLIIGGVLFFLFKYALTEISFSLAILNGSVAGSIQVERGGGSCASLFVNVSMFFLIGAVAVTAASGRHLSPHRYTEGMQEEYSLFGETTAFSILPPIVVLALGHWHVPNAMRVLLVSALQLNSHTMPHFACYTLNRKLLLPVTDNS